MRIAQNQPRQFPPNAHQFLPEKKVCKRPVYKPAYCLLTDMLRLLEHGLQVKMVYTEFNTQAVDTEAVLARVEKLMQNDPLLSRY